MATKRVMRNNFMAQRLQQTLLRSGDALQIQQSSRLEFPCANGHIQLPNLFCFLKRNFSKCATSDLWASVCHNHQNDNYLQSMTKGWPTKKSYKVCSVNGILNCVKRHHSSGVPTGSNNYISEQLTNRGIIRVYGVESQDFLQGLITMDMRCLDHESKRGCKSIYAMMLNIKGRVLYDMIVHNITKPGDKPCYLLDVDNDVVNEMISTMKRYKIRKKIDLTDISKEYKVWATFNETTPTCNAECDLKMKSVDSSYLSCTSDPRLKGLGCRAVLPDGVKASEVMENVAESTHQGAFRLHRYKLGVGEGVIDHPPGNCIPLECNLVFLNGVSFDKGCYIGQELTARSHHTGVIRKRLMPLAFLRDENHNVQSDSVITNAAGKNIGKLRGVSGHYGLGLLRFSQAEGMLAIKSSSKENTELSAHKPFWWPTDIQ